MKTGKFIDMHLWYYFIDLITYLRNKIGVCDYMGGIFIIAKKCWVNIHKFGQSWLCVLTEIINPGYDVSKLLINSKIK